jgi:hypothetical protein
MPFLFSLMPFYTFIERFSVAIITIVGIADTIIALGAIIILLIVIVVCNAGHESLATA